MKIIIYDVNFGEAILYQSKGDQEHANQLLVDCGAYYYPAGKLAYDRVIDDIKKPTNLLITHFDRDHYNGILEIDDGYKFDEIILPKYYYDKNSGAGITMELFVDSLLLWTYGMVTGKKKKISFIHNLFMKIPMLVQYISDIKCVGAGDSFCFGSEKSKILWPKENSNINRKLYSAEVREIIKMSYYQTDYLEERINLQGDAKEMISDMLSNLDEKHRRENVWSKVQEIRERCENFKARNDAILEDFFYVADEYVFTLVKLYVFLCGKWKINNDADDRGIVDSLLGQLQELYELLDNAPINVQLDRMSKDRMKNIGSRCVRNMNECSVVFSIRDEVIAFGDATKRVIREIKGTTGFCEKYKVVKVPHHGTRAYWTEELPIAKRYLVSNSGEKNLKWSIYEKYGEKYKDRMMCTNNNENRCVHKSTINQCTNCNSTGMSRIVLDTDRLS